jgi:hypothetical protein
MRYLYGELLCLLLKEWEGPRVQKKNKIMEDTLSDGGVDQDLFQLLKMG